MVWSGRASAAAGVMLPCPEHYHSLSQPAPQCCLAAVPAAVTIQPERSSVFAMASAGHLHRSYGRPAGGAWSSPHAGPAGRPITAACPCWSSL